MLVELSKTKEFRLKTSEEQLREYFTELKIAVTNGNIEPTEALLYTNDNREIFISVIDPEKAFSDLTAIVGEAHADDAVLGEGINNISAGMGVGVTYVTMTDGSARVLEGYETPRDLALQRRKESVEAARKAGAAMVINLGYPDGSLGNYKYEAAKDLQSIMDIINPRYILAPNRQDTHRDHAAGYAVANRARHSKKTSLYGMDTQSMKGKWGFSLRPTHHFEVSQGAKLIRDEEYDTHGSQVNVPNRKDVDQVFAMPEIRGAQKGWKYGGVLHKAWFSRDSLTPLLQQNGIEVTRRTTPSILFERVKGRFGLAA